MLPEGEDTNEWVACNVVDFYNQINMLYGTIAEVCTKQNCPVMNAGPKVEYYWADGTTVKRPIRLSAPDYRKIIKNVQFLKNSKFHKNFDYFSELRPIIRLVSRSIRRRNNISI